LDDTALDGLAATPEEHERAHRFRHPKDAETFLRGRAALRIALREITGVKAEDLVFDRTCLHCGDPGHGKPRLLGPTDAIAWRFSAARARGVLGVVLSRTREVGFDVESYERVQDADLIANRFFTATERTWWSKHDEDDMAGAFLRIWTRKEAYVKLRGSGLATPLEEIDTIEWTDGACVEDPLDANRSMRIVAPPSPEGTVATLIPDGSEPIEIKVHTWPEGK
jgi:4'-phosphopantetheinyl transferase